MNNTIFIS